MISQRRRIVLAPVMLLAATQALGAPGDTELVSLATHGAAAGRAGTFERTTALSADGRYVAFVSYAADLVTGDTNNHADVFVCDLRDGTIERVSVSTTGAQGNDASESVDLSGDGRYVVFSSVASNLVANDTNGRSDVFLHDRQTGSTVRVSVSSTGAQGDNFSMQPAISRNGQVIAFTSFASNLVPDDTNRENDVFVHVRGSGVTERVSLSSSGQQGSGGNLSSSLSSDGRYVAFASGVPTFFPGDTNGYADVFVRDRVTGVTERVSVSSAGVQGDRPSREPSISDDGRYVAFESEAFNLTGGFEPGSSWTSDIFVHDRVTGETELVSAGSSGTPSEEASYGPDISADGRHVVFRSGAPDLVPGDNNGLYDFFWHDRVEARTERASVATNGAQANGHSYWGALSADGLHVAFVSEATNLTSGDANATADVYVHEPGGPGTGPGEVKWSLRPRFQSFGRQTVDTFVWRRFAVENLGNVPLLLDVSLAGRDASAFVIRNDCGSSVPVGQTCLIRVAFHPMTPGDKVARLRVVGGDDEVRERPLSGTGVPGSFTVTPASIAFGGIAVGSESERRVVTITNTGLGVLPLAYAPARLDGARPGQFSRHDNCTSSLGAGESCTVDVRFVPKLKGALSAQLVVTAGGLTSPQRVALTGRGL